MKANKIGLAILGGVVAAFGLCASAGAQLGDLKGLAGGGDMSSLASGSAGNAAGVVEYCVKNNYLGGGAAGLKDKLMGKVTGDSDKAEYDDGAKGIVKTSDGKSVDIGKLGEMKKSVTKKACSAVLDHAKSLL
ncbi:MAG: DUF2501 domain-containing protein [Proteobacteria bacterium]|uniref:DUF2501 domain-containing protein n=1 Tax=Rudaea sp. TaxID=2136325 RepID=UPI0032201190|nr:DUF2501 domain-containing protein [Pseudomonadota bacterium]